MSLVMVRYVHMYFLSRSSARSVFCQLMLSVILVSILRYLQRWFFSHCTALFRLEMLSLANPQRRSVISQC